MRICLLAFLLLAPALAHAQEARPPEPRAPQPREPRPAQPVPAVPPPAQPPPAQAPADPPRYLAAMRAELASMQLRDTQCEQDDAVRGHCSFRARGLSTGRDFQLHLHYSDNTDTIYVYVE